jgi:hypothetical protein
MEQTDTPKTVPIVSEKETPTLRDKFAMAALVLVGDHEQLSDEVIAHFAYDIADEMMERRKVEKP